MAAARPNGRALRQLTVLFLAWKALIVVVACASPGVGYDTSTQILFDQYRSTRPTRIQTLLEHAVLRLTRWDGIYFATLSERGHVNEQDWAFSWLLTQSVNWFLHSFPWSLTASPIVDKALICIVVSHIAHFLSVLVLHRIALELVPRSNPSRSRIAFTAAALHVVSPAGVFLSAPSGESAFAWFNFVGTLSYVYAINLKSASLAKEAAFTVLAGLAFGIAAMMRGNGLLSGILFASDALQDILQPRSLLSSWTRLGRLAATGLAGMLVGIGYAVPQVVAYLEYCTNGHTRPWCQKLPPSIFSWVQSHYWAVGFLRYWTLSNAPLFLLAAPMIAILLMTGIAALRGSHSLSKVGRTVGAEQLERENFEQKRIQLSLRRLAVPQLVLALLTTTTFHVQIINRISSGYPLWYIVLAMWLHTGSAAVRGNSAKVASGEEHPGRLEVLPGASTSMEGMADRHLQKIVRGIVTYAIVQGGLYACFLPPA